jgi:serine/threonine-protein kinase HipA
LSVWRALGALSTNPSEDVATLFTRALFTWLIADGDMHLKNVAMLKIAAVRSRIFAGVGMAPLYDTLTTRVFPGLHYDHMALKLAGKDDRLHLADFETCARTIDLPLRKARDIISQLATTLGDALDAIALPQLVRNSVTASDTAEAVLEIVRIRHTALAGEL